MAHIIPFRGYRYNPQKVDNLGAVMSPPYDSVSEEEKTALYRLHEYNAVRLDLGMDYEDDDDSNNRYTRAAALMRQWIDECVLIRDKEDAVYMYEQDIEYNGTHFSNKGFVALLKLEEFSNGIIMPCEETITSSKRDRYKLLEHTNTDSSMINCMYIESDNSLMNLMTEISDREPVMKFSTLDGIQQRLWEITDKQTIAFIQKNFDDKRLFITDGQNRYETCLAYKKQMSEQNPNHTGQEKYNYIMTLLTDANNDGLVQLPVHRLISRPKGFREDYFISAVQDHFRIEKIIVDADVKEFVETMRRQIATPRKENRIAVYCGGDYFYRLILKDTQYLETIMPDKSPAYRGLDVTVLNHLLLEEVLGINENNYHEQVTFTKRLLSGVKKVQQGEYNCIFIINPTKASQISAVAVAGEKMPERSISIFPKPATGILFNRLDD